MKKSMIVTDLDGTLFTKDGNISYKNKQTLQHLKKQNILRVIATGRSLYSAKKILTDDFPIDILIFSSGAGIYHWQTQELFYQKSLNSLQVKDISEFLRSLKLDFMVHHPVPDSHKFDYFTIPENNEDFFNRIKLYENESCFKEYSLYKFNNASQFLVIIPDLSEKTNKTGIEIYNIVKDKLSDYSVIRTTSPLNHKDIWIEIFPNDIDKAFGVKFLQKTLNIEQQQTACIGNDFNDYSMLAYSENSFVVANAPDELKTVFKVVSDCNQNGFTEAVEYFLRNKS